MYLDETTPLHMASDDVREEAWRGEHASCEPCAWSGIDAEVCLGDAHPDDLLCHGDVPPGKVIDDLPHCAGCALAAPVLRAMGVDDWDVPRRCDLCGQHGSHRAGCPGGPS